MIGKGSVAGGSREKNNRQGEAGIGVGRAWVLKDGSINERIG